MRPALNALDRKRTHTTVQDRARLAPKLDPANRLPFDREHVTTVPRTSGVYIIYDLAGPIYAGRSHSDIRQRLQAHLTCAGNRNIALAQRAGAGRSLMFTYCCLPPTQQADAERLLIAALGLAKFANLRHEGVYEDSL